MLSACNNHTNQLRNKYILTAVLHLSRVFKGCSESKLCFCQTPLQARLAEDHDKQHTAWYKFNSNKEIFF